MNKRDFLKSTVAATIFASKAIAATYIVQKEGDNEIASPPVNKELEEKIAYLRNENKIAYWELPAVRGILYTQAADLDKILKHYNQDPKIFHDIMSQESGYKIDSIGQAGEKGTAQFMKTTVDSIAQRVANPKDPLYYPGFKREDYKFENLSIDYRLNNILKTAYLKYIDNKIKKNNINKDDVFKELKSKALTLNYEKWKNQAEKYKDTLVIYLGYNANGNINDETIYNMGLLMKNAKDFKAIRDRVFKALEERAAKQSN